VAVPPGQGTGLITSAMAVSRSGWFTSMLPVSGPQLFASVILHEYAFPAVIPGNIPVALVTPLNVYDSGAVPPDPVMVTVAVPP